MHQSSAQHCPNSEDILIFFNFFVIFKWKSNSYAYTGLQFVCYLVSNFILQSIPFLIFCLLFMLPFCLNCLLLLQIISMKPSFKIILIFTSIISRVDADAFPQTYCHFKNKQYLLLGWYWHHRQYGKKDRKSVV